ncbi:MAG: UDP-N-acetylglucosamine--N-acetylmuramyl-(pentapeptide) pyrophosphoryl-undecaprenol N-acetylglucosamine transferase [Planctomycetota bacterium]|jgi:UDP-N-acetylglucosamine--N-acetylmuramyl-(pentapeptide) pyrophosphoryl-undecaprenol N-acetylglucosamine transferase
MRVVFSGGGTGGHLFPGIALAESLPSGSSHFLCTRRAFDLDQLDRRRLPFTAVGKWSVRRALRVLRGHNADVVVGLGGGGSLAGLLAAALRGVPFVCHEQNVIPGRLNRLAARGARRFYAQWRQSRRYPRSLNGRFLWSGTPLRKMARRNPIAARIRYGLDSDWPTILVIGGSQGAEFLNREIPDAASEIRARVQFLHLVGRPGRVDDVMQIYRENGIAAKVLAFEQEMEWAYSAADYAVSRAGAVALAELCRFRIPALLIPYPHARDDHQYLNAEVVAATGAAHLVREERFTKEGFRKWVSILVSPDLNIDNVRRALKSLDRPDAVQTILEDLRERVLK